MAPRRTDLVLLAVALGAGWLFFSHLGTLWPLARVELNADRARLEAQARAELTDRGFELGDAHAASRLVVDEPALDHLERAFDRERTQQLIAGGLPVYWYEVHFKARGEPDRWWATVHPGGGLLGWGRTLQEDATGAVLSPAEARELFVEGPESVAGGESREEGAPEGTREGAARRALRLAVAEGSPDQPWRERGAGERALPGRVDHRFVYERILSAEPELRERLTVTVGGGRVSAVERTVAVPEAARRIARMRRAPAVALRGFGLLGLGVATVAAFAVFLTRLRAGVARLGPPVLWAAVVGLCFLATEALQGAALLLAWDPLWPRWISDLQVLGLAAAGGAVITLFLLVVISAGDTLDREVAGGRRGASLWLAGKGRLADPAVGLASIRGFLVGLLCGGVMTLSVLALRAWAGAWVPIQPRGFFFYALNSGAPALSILLYFLMVALAEELGYRFFAGSWLLRLARRSRASSGGAAILAVTVPAVIYGTVHTGLDFLPPEEPFWGRALVFTLVGCVWGWAFLRFDALTVVLSHWTADLFIFNWPRLASGEPALVASAVATLGVPLVPALAWALRSLGAEGRGGGAGISSER